MAARGKLLRALQEGEIERVGDTQTRRANVRAVAATKLDPKDEIRAGRCREDLYFRLNVFPIRVPSLRQRREDLPILFNHMLRKYGERRDRNVTGFTDRALDAVLNYGWPGNIREMESIVDARRHPRAQGRRDRYRPSFHQWRDRRHRNVWHWRRRFPHYREVSAISTDPGDDVPLPPGTNLAVLYYRHAFRDSTYHGGEQAGMPFRLETVIAIARYVRYVRYVRYLSVAGFTVDVQAIVPFGSVRLSQPASSVSNGAGDPFLGTVIWLLNDQIAKRYLAFGAFPGIPIGSYDATKGPVNVGSNQWQGIFQISYGQPIYGKPRVRRHRRIRALRRQQ
jgi:hypothetical protein